MDNPKLTLRGHYARIQTRFSMTFAVMGIFISLLTTVLIFFDSRAHLLDEFKQRAVSMVALVAQQQNSDLHARILSPSDQGGPGYSLLKLTNQKMLEVEPNIGSIYTMRQDADGKIYFVVDVVNTDLIKHPAATVGQFYPDAGPQLVANFAKIKSPMSEEDIYTDAWGSWMTAYAPIYRPDGKMEAIIGLDLSAQYFIDAQNSLIRTMLLIFSALLIPVIIIGWLVGNSVAKPILLLKNSVQRIVDGDMKYRVFIQTGDEIEQLAFAFNEMTDRLQALITGLEISVEKRTNELSSRTKELENSTEMLNRQATELKAVSEVARGISSVRDTTTLLPVVTRIISEKFGFYHVGIFLNDPGDEYTSLRAANSEGGQRMLERGHKLRIGQVGIVGLATATGRPRIALDTGEDAHFFNNPDLPETRSEMALPLKSPKGVIGALDVQSTDANAFDQQDLEILNTLADLVTIAIQNADLFQTAHKASTEANRLLRQYSQSQWIRMIDEQDVSGYHFQSGATAPLTQTMAILAEGDAGERTTSAVIPIRIRDEVVGEIGIRLPRAQSLDQDELDIAEAIAERVGLAIENARLLEDSQKRATKERTIGEVSNRISSSVNVESVMQIAVEELGRILQGSNVTIRLEKEQLTESSDDI